MAAATEKLYWKDASTHAFETTGATLASSAGKPSVVLPRSIFYPEGGGQLGDTGRLTIGTTLIAIADTQIDEVGAIHHVVVGELPSDISPDAVVHGAVDVARRRDHTVQHTAQHALSRALLEAARASTVSARLGATACTIDVDRASLSDADLHRAEDLVNGVVTSDVAVTTSFPTPEELASLDLRKQPNVEKSAAGVRIVTIEGFDVTPCGGTHCTRTGQIGQIRIAKTEKYKGMTRITFHAGARALADARANDAILGAIAAELTCGRDDAFGAIAKLRAEGKAARERLEAARGELAELLARALLEPLREAQGPHVVSVVRPKDDLAGLRALAGELAKDARVAALVGGADEGTGEVVLVVARGKDAKLDCGAFVQAQARARGGRGGGRPERAEGRFPRGTSVEVLAAAARSAC
ncbi:MAG: alanyl-tRNA editing protein [Deltaproteobacteria bacterium]|nr:alanyl-tRNA editing protein [Deltaproteobacteria bacterium]